MNTCRFHKDMIDTRKAVVEYDCDGEFMESGTIKSSPFLLSLFTRVSDHGILYSPCANFRMAMAENFMTKDSNKPSMLANAYRGKEYIFSTNAMQVMFFQEKNLCNDDGKSKGSEYNMQSMARESLKIGGTIRKDLVVKFKKVGVFPSTEQMLKVAYILNVKVGYGRGTKELDFGGLFDDKLRNVKPMMYQLLG